MSILKAENTSSRLLFYIRIEYSVWHFGKSRVYYFGGIEDLRCFYHPNDGWDWEDGASFQKMLRYHLTCLFTLFALKSLIFIKEFKYIVQRENKKFHSSKRLIMKNSSNLPQTSLLHSLCFLITTTSSSCFSFYLHFSKWHAFLMR